MDAAVGVVTETWLAYGDSLEDDIRDFANGAGIGMLYRNRVANGNGVAHGGVAIVYETGCCTAKKIDIPNPEDFEVMSAVVSC